MRLALYRVSSWWICLGGEGGGGGVGEGRWPKQKLSKTVTNFRKES